MSGGLCPICGEPSVYPHAPDGRCDECAADRGCECGCFGNGTAMGLRAVWDGEWMLLSPFATEREYANRHIL